MIFFVCLCHFDGNSTEDFTSDIQKKAKAKERSSRLLCVMFHGSMRKKECVGFHPNYCNRSRLILTLSAEKTH